jgi:MFS transporter, FSR family, fosmidomycin resistance protein
MDKMKIISSNLIVFGTAHALVDAICASILFNILNEQALSVLFIAYLFLTYNILAFGLQALLGWLTDKFKTPKLTALLGITLTGISVMVFHPLPIAGVILAGIGNALFHVGGGSISLSLTPGKASAPGIFVAPGALGLMVGTLLGKSAYFPIWPFLLISALLFVLIMMNKTPLMYQSQSMTPKAPKFNFECVIIMVLFVVATRSLVGAVITFPWKSDIYLLVMLTCSIALGKGLGGFLADRFGWTPTTVGSLIISIPLLIFGVNAPVLGMAGIFLFNITMPVTLAMVSNMIPGKPGFAFGLACLALVLGAVLAFTELKFRLNNSIFIITIISVSAIVLYFGLHYYHRWRTGNRIETRILSLSGSGANSEE